MEARLKKELQGQRAPRARSEAGPPQNSGPEAGPVYPEAGPVYEENGSNHFGGMAPMEDDEAAWHAFYEQELDDSEFPEGVLPLTHSFFFFFITLKPSVE